MSDPCDLRKQDYLRVVDLPNVEGATVTLLIGSEPSFLKSHLRAEVVRNGTDGCPDTMPTLSVGLCCGARI